MTPRGSGYLIKTINDKLKTQADAALKNHALTFSQSCVLTFLNGQGGQATQKEIEDFMEVSHPTTVGIVSRMEENGYVTTWFDARQRSKQVRLTPKARAIGAEMDQVIQLQEDTMLRGLSKKEIVELERLLAVVHNNLK